MRKNRVWLLLTLIVLMMSAPTLVAGAQATECSEFSSAEAYLSAGMDEASQNHSAEALALYACAISLDSGDARAYLMSAYSYSELRQLDNALSDLETALELSTQYPFIQFSGYGLQGDIYFALRDYDAALTSFEHAIAIGRESAADFGEDGIRPRIRFLMDRALLYVEIDQFPQAYRDVSESLQIAPDSAIAHAVLAVLLQRLGDQDGFIREMQMANELDSNVANTFAALGRLLYDIRDYRRSLVYLTYALQIRSQPQIADYVRRAMAASDAGLYEIAIMDYSAAIELEPHASMYFYRGVSYYQIGEYTLALTDLETAQRLEPRDPEVYLYLGHTYYALHLLRSARQSYEAYLLSAGHSIEHASVLVERIYEINAALQAP